VAVVVRPTTASSHFRHRPAVVARDVVADADRLGTRAKNNVNRDDTPENIPRNLRNAVYIKRLSGNLRTAKTT
jgi:hypothetical protein